MASVKAFRALLTKHKIRGRSSARTLDELRELCIQHGLLDAPWHELPRDIFLEVMAVLTHDLSGPDVLRRTALVCKTLLSLVCTCRAFRDALGVDNPLWQNILTAFAAASEYHCRDLMMAESLVRSGKITAKRALTLVCLTGCECCGAPRIRKVHWEFRVRMCHDCIVDHTVSDYRLTREAGLKCEDFFDLPHVERTMWARWIGKVRPNFFWQDDVVRRVRELYSDIESQDFDEVFDLLVQRKKEKEAIARAKERERRAAEKAARLLKQRELRSALKAHLVPLGWPEASINETPIDRVLLQHWRHRQAFNAASSASELFESDPDFRRAVVDNFINHSASRQRPGPSVDMLAGASIQLTL